MVIYPSTKVTESSGQTKSLRFLVSALVASDPWVDIFFYPISNCSQNCLIDWNSALLFHIGIWTFALFVRPLLATILCIWEILSVCIHVSHISLIAKKEKEKKRLPKKKEPKKKRVAAPILKPIYDQKLETVSFGLIWELWKNSQSLEGVMVATFFATCFCKKNNNECLFSKCLMTRWAYILIELYRKKAYQNSQCCQHYQCSSSEKHRM